MPPLIKTIAKIGYHLPLNSERLQKLTENYVVNNKKNVAEMGESLPIQSKEGLFKTFQSLKNNNHLQ